MTILSFIPIIGDIIDKGLGIVDSMVEDKDKANELKHAIKNQILVQQHDEIVQRLKSQSEIIIAEATGESSAQRSWRPHLMYLIMFLLVFNGVVVPLGEAIFHINIPILEAWNAIPENMWSLLMIGLGGYIGGRTAEKIVKEMHNKDA
jgi:hypothetical protein